MVFSLPCGLTGVLQWKRRNRPALYRRLLGSIGVWMLPVFVLSVCACNEKEDPYSDLSRLVAERNEARKAIARERKLMEKDAPGAIQSKKKGVPKKGDVATVALVERKVSITDSNSGTVMARGVAYLDKSGKIVRIKIIKD